MPKVTVVIPTYNRREYLKEAIESVLAQTFQDFKIAVFDNGSDYDIDSFLKGFNDPRIILEGLEKNIGSDGNFDRIFRYAYNSPYVVVFHDDDVMCPELLQQEVSAMDAHPDLVWVGTDTRFVEDHRDMQNFPTSKGSRVLIYDTPGVARLILQGFNLCYDSVMYRSRHFTGVPLHARYSKWGDRPYLISLLQRGKAGILKEQLVNYRIHPGQDSQSSVRDTVQYAINLLLFYKDALHGLRTASDRRLFYSHVANAVIPAAIVSSHTIAEFWQFIAPYRERGLLDMRYVNARGVFRSVRAIVRRIRKKIA